MQFLSFHCISPHQEQLQLSDEVLMIHERQLRLQLPHLRMELFNDLGVQMSEMRIARHVVPLGAACINDNT